MHGKIVLITGANSGSLDLGNLQGERRYNFLGAYNRSKLGNILFTYVLARRLAGTHVTANCVSPGPTATRFGDDMGGLPALFPYLVKRIPFLLVDPRKGAETTVFVASSPDLTGVTGRFFLRCRERRTKAITYDLRAAANLWSVSEKLTSGQVSVSVARRGAVERR